MSDTASNTSEFKFEKKKKIEKKPFNKGRRGKKRGSKKIDEELDEISDNENEPESLSEDDDERVGDNNQKNPPSSELLAYFPPPFSYEFEPICTSNSYNSIPSLPFINFLSSVKLEGFSGSRPKVYPIQSMKESISFSLLDLIKQMKWEDTDQSRNHLLEFFDYLIAEPPFFFTSVSSPPTNFFGSSSSSSSSSSSAPSASSSSTTSSTSSSSSSQYTYSISFISVCTHLQTRIVEDAVYTEKPFSSLYVDDAMKQVYRVSSLQGLALFRALALNGNRYLSLKQV
jgi:hypothetical protein